ncbi:MAG: Uma2 family endonuclease, partial [Chloroflexota bacterium]
EHRYELVRGELVCMAPSGSEHSEIGMLIGHFILTYVLGHQSGIVTGPDGGFLVRKDPDTVLVPDVAFVHRDRLTSELDRTRYLPLAPDLVVEIVSPSDRMADVTGKVQTYFEAGTRLIWIVLPQQQAVMVHYPDGTARTLKSADTLDGEDVLPGLEIPIAGIFNSPASSKE